MRLVTWNVLADAYLRPDWYRGVPPALLEPDRRRSAVCTRAAGLEADVLCLQEVDEACFAALGRLLGVLGYRGTFRRKGLGKPDGCATFWRGLSATSESVLAFAVGSGHVAQSTTFEHVRVVTTHLKWDAPDSAVATRWGMRQSDELLTWVRDEPRPLIVCGDFNVRADDQVMARFEAGGLRDAFDGSHRPHTSSTNGRSAKIDHVVSSVPGLRPAALQFDQVGVTSLPNEAEPSDHVPLLVEW
jgi:mRNA deadenylase 3'-5' endonuclease subunit Ccr4